MITANDVILALSGGSNNSDPSRSLGGNPSIQAVNPKTLFDTITNTEALNGLIDYRCVYLFNNNSTLSLYNCQISISSNISGGSDIAIGVVQTTDIQTIVFDGVASGGSFIISYEGENVVVNYDSTLATFANNLQNGLNGLNSLSGITVTGQSESGNITFTITFGGDDNNRNHELLELVSNNLTGNPSLTFSKISEGSPVNAISQEISYDTISPNGVEFTASTISVGTLNPEDGVPIWIRRTTNIDTSSLQEDGFTLRISASNL